MAIRKTGTGKFELTISHKLLEKRLYFTFATEQEAAGYETEAKKWLNVGIVPTGLEVQKTQPSVLFTALIQKWRNAGNLSKTDDELLGRLVMDSKLASIQLSHIDYPWVEGFVEYLKRDRNLAPSTIRGMVQALSKPLDWHIRGGAATANPFKLLPRNYSTYTKADALIVKPKIDQVRDRRLEKGEYERIVQALAGVKREDRERAFPKDPQLTLLFHIILYTGLRLREAYGIRCENIGERVIKVQTSKQKHGVISYRDVPIRPELKVLLKEFIKQGVTTKEVTTKGNEPIEAEHKVLLKETQKQGLLFDFWDGTEGNLIRCSNNLSHRFSALFSYANCEDLHEHDLRHEATCRWLELKTKDGHWMFNNLEIHRIMGWSKNSQMINRYASFRVETLADRLWE